ncbi:MAG: S24 family peptidase [Bacillota bacterium]|nr:S24 family peptidase [Bacillota bacterium]
MSKKNLTPPTPSDKTNSFDNPDDCELVEIDGVKIKKTLAEEINADKTFTDNPDNHIVIKIFATMMKKLRTERHVTQESIGHYLGVGKSTISNYETTYSRPNIVHAYLIAEKLNASLDYMTGRVYNLRDSGTENSNRHIPIVEHIIYGKNPVSSDNIIDDMVLPCFNLTSGEFLGMIVPDNSMNRSEVKKGAIAIIRRQSEVTTGDIVLVATKDYGTVLRKVFVMDGGISLYPDATDPGYAPITLIFNTDKFEIIGRLSKLEMSL